MRDMTRITCTEITANGKSLGFVWRDSTAETHKPDQEEMKALHAAGLLHGPFATKAEARHQDVEQTLPEGRWVTMN
jgi:hypothetical protein